MRSLSFIFLFAALSFGVGCSSSGNGNGGKKDMGTTGGGGGICPAHPENCSGTCCGSGCVDTSIDIKNCGGCNAACTAGTVCMGGHCGCLPSGAPCSGTQTCCPNAGCADLTSDIRNCGACGHACGDGSSCVAGICRCGTVTCTGTQICCSGNCADSTACTVSMPDMAMPGGLPLCNCMMLVDPTGSNNQCPVTSQCVGNNCCAEDQALCATFGCPPGTCVDPTPCQTSVTPH